MSKELKIPSTWLQVTFSDLFLDPKNNIVGGPFGSNLKSSEYRTEGIPVFRIQNIDRNKFIDKNINYVSEEKAEFLSKHSFKSGDIIITKLCAPLGKTCFVPKNYEKGIIVADLIRARVDNKNINPKFIVYQLNSPFFIKQFARFTKGTTRPRIKLSIVRDLTFNLPPLYEQQRIVNTIEDLFSDLDNGVQHLKIAQHQLKVYRQTLLKCAFEGKLTESWRKENKPESAKLLLKCIKEQRQKLYGKELSDWRGQVKIWEEEGKKGKKPIRVRKLKALKAINKRDIADYSRLPENWRWTRIGDIVYKVGDVDHRMPKDYPNGIPYLSTRNVKADGTLSFTNVKTISAKDYLSLSRKIKPERNDIIFPRYGTIGRNALVSTDEQFLVSYSCAIIKTIPKLVNPKYLFFYTISPVVQKEIKKHVVQTTQPNIGISSIENFVFPLCSEQEQELVAQELESQFSIIEHLEKTISLGIQHSQFLSQSILKKAFEGKLVDQEPNDKSAFELLKCIQEEGKKYWKEQKLQKKKVPKKTRKMSKKLSIIDVLKASDKPMSARDVWQQSTHNDDIEEFYSELKNIQDSIKEVKKGTESLLSFTK